MNSCFILAKYGQLYLYAFALSLFFFKWMLKDHEQIRVGKGGSGR